MPETVLRTTKCAGLGHPEFTLWCDEELLFLAPWLVSWLEHRVAEKAVFRPGETVQIGWSILLVETLDDGTLTLLEPEMSGLPGRARRSVSSTLLHLCRQKSVAEGFDLTAQMDFPDLRHAALSCARYAKGVDLMLSRLPRRAEDSGWFFGCLEKDHDHKNPAELKGATLYELACLNPSTIDFLALPVGTIVSLNAAGDFVSAQDARDHPLVPATGSYLHEKAIRRWGQ